MFLLDTIQKMIVDLTLGHRLRPQMNGLKLKIEEIEVSARENLGCSGVAR
jgi:hypothetical protein